MKALDMIFAVLLLVTAALQLNDPDPAYWVAAYGLGAIVAFLHAFGNRAEFLAALTIGMMISGMIYALPGFTDYLDSQDWASITGSMDGPNAYVEPAREFIGLLMGLVIVATYPLRWRES